MPTPTQRPRAVLALAAFGLVWGALATPTALAASPSSSPAPSSGSVGLVRHQHLDLGPFRFRSGASLPLRLGYEAYGQPKADRSNAVLICHFFGGTGHAAGRLSPEDPRPGYWEELIGPGKAIDTRRYWVIAPDVPANVNRRPWLETTGPQSLDPSTGRPYGQSFPPVRIEDMVESQARLAQALGVRRWAAVVGASLGGMQALRWAVDRPGQVAKAVAIAAPGRCDGYVRTLTQLQLDAIRNDPEYGRGAPLKGLGQAWTLLMLQGLGRPAMAAEGPAAPGFGPDLLAELQAQAPQRAAHLDAEAWLRLAEAAQAHDLGEGHGGMGPALARLEAKLLLLSAQDDLLFPPAAIEAQLALPLRRTGKAVQHHRFPTRHGHLGLLYEAKAYAPQLASFLR